MIDDDVLHINLRLHNAVRPQQGTRRGRLRPLAPRILPIEVDTTDSHDLARLARLGLLGRERRVHDVISCYPRDVVDAPTFGAKQQRGSLTVSTPATA